MPERRIRLPLSAERRSQRTYLKLLERADPLSRLPFAWRGRFFSPGSTISESDLWPDGPFPRVPLLVEYCGALSPDRGHNRRLSDETVVLWCYDRAAREFHELGRVVAPAGMWSRLLEPLVREAMRRDGDVSAVDVELIRERIAHAITAELDQLGSCDRVRVLTAVHDELASRIAEWLPLQPDSKQAHPLHQ